MHAECFHLDQHLHRGRDVRHRHPLGDLEHELLARESATGCVSSGSSTGRLFGPPLRSGLTVSESALPLDQVGKGGRGTPARQEVSIRLDAWMTNESTMDWLHCHEERLWAWPGSMS